jgi:hypothetical protein
MSLSESDRRALDEMLTDLCEGRLDDSQCERLLQRLEEPEVQDCLVSHAMLDADLRAAGEDAEEILLPSSAAAAKGRSPVLGFLGNLMGGEGWPNVSRFSGYMFAALTAIALMLSVAVVLLVGGPFFRPGSQEIAKSPPGGMSGQPADTSSPLSATWGQRQGPAPALPRASSPVVDSSPQVARLTRSVDCCWSDPTSAPRRGESFGPGRELQIESGVIELQFGVGVRAVVQGPARLDLLGPTKVFLYAGKMTSEILKPEARGFEVRTPKGSVVDLGTEFGVEVTPSQDVKVDVFKGEVVVNQSVAHSEGQHLKVNQGLRLEGDLTAPQLVDDRGESFIRNIEDADRDRHVVAYWRFEDRPIGTFLPATHKNAVVVRATVDSSFNGNDLYAFERPASPAFSADVPAGAVPQSGSVNRSCLDNTRPTYASCRNVYTHSRFSHAAPLDIQAITPAKWTIEASVKAAKLEGKPHPFIVRDATYSAEKRKVPPRLVLEINASGRFAVSFFDVSGRFHKAVAEDPALEANRWYHVATVSDGRRLRLYVNALDGRGYRQCASAELPATGSTALGKGADEAEWAIGRSGNHGIQQQFIGWIDEVRVSDIARQPDDFLFARRQQNSNPKSEPIANRKSHNPKT